MNLTVNILCAVAVLVLSFVTVRGDEQPLRGIATIGNYIFMGVLILFGVDDIARGNKYAIMVLAVYLVARYLRSYLNSIFEKGR